MEREFQKGGQFSAMEMANKMQQQLEHASSVHSLNNMLKRVKGLNLEGQLAGLISTEDTLKKYLQSSSYNSILDNANNSAMQQLSNIITENKEIFKDTATALSLTRAFETALSSYKVSTQIISPVGFANEKQISELNVVMSKATKVLNQFSNLESFKALSGLKHFPLDEILATNLTTSDIEEISESSLAEIDAKLSDEIKSITNFSLFSDKDKKYLSYIFHTYLLPFLYLIIGVLITPHIQHAQQELNTLTTQKEVKAFIKSPSDTFDHQALKGHRFTIVNDLNLRDNFGMNSTITDTLPIGTVVRVIDKSNKSWLLVEVKINGELEQGWVLRRYTTYFK
jgi:hypothetical protein